MITNFKIFEKLGIDKIVYDITEKVWKTFLENYNKKLLFTTNKPVFDTDISEYDIGHKTLGIRINYNNTESSAGFPINIGAIDREDNTKPKSLNQFKEEIIHEVQHDIYALRKTGRIKGVKKFNYNKKEFLRSSGVDHVIADDIVGSFKDEDSNIYGQKISIQNFLKYNGFSDNYKNLIIFLYLAEDNELSSKFHQFIIKIKNSNNYLEEINNNSTYKFLKKMIDFKMKTTDFTENELSRIKSILFDLKDMKKVQKYINMKGEKFVLKVHKLLYFKDSEIEL